MFINDKDDIPISEMISNLDKMESVFVRKQRKLVEIPAKNEVKCLIDEDDNY